MTLPEFLQARIAEDEGMARAAIGIAVFSAQSGRWVTEDVSDRFGPIPLVFAITRWDPARVLAECETKRRIVERAVDAEKLQDHSLGRQGAADAYQTVLELLGLPYADHPDYQQEWKP